MTQYQVTLNEQTLQRLVTSDSQLAHLLEAILWKRFSTRCSMHSSVSSRRRSATNVPTSDKAIVTATSPASSRRGRDAHLAGAPGARRRLLPRALPPLPAQRTSSHPHLDGDGRPRRLPAQSDAHYRRALWLGVR